MNCLLRITTILKAYPRRFQQILANLHPGNRCSIVSSTVLAKNTVVTFQVHVFPSQNVFCTQHPLVEARRTLCVLVDRINFIAICSFHEFEHFPSTSCRAWKMRRVWYPRYDPNSHFLSLIRTFSFQKRM